MPLVRTAKARRPAWQDNRPPEPELRGAYAIAADQAPKFARIVRDAIKRLAIAIDEPALRRAVRARDIDAVVAAFEWYNPEQPQASPTWERMRQSIERAYGQTIERSGQAEIRRRGFVVKQALPFEFTGLIDNPYSQPWARANAARLVTDISIEGQAVLRGIVTDAFEAQAGKAPLAIRTPIADALIADAPELMGLTAREARAVINRREDLVFVQGISDAAFVNASTAVYAEQLLRQRAMRIARTETIAAEARGAMDSWRVAGDRGLINRQTAGKEWIASNSARTCPICIGLDGVIVRLDQSFPDGSDHPPSHPQCRCTLALVT